MSFFSTKGSFLAAAQAVNEVIPGIVSISYLLASFFWVYEYVLNIEGSPRVIKATSLPLSK